MVCYAVLHCAQVLLPCEEELLTKVPTRSIVAQEAAANGVVTALADFFGVTLETFVYNHPGGAIGAAPKGQR